MIEAGFRSGRSVVIHGLMKTTFYRKNREKLLLQRTSFNDCFSKFLPDSGGNLKQFDSATGLLTAHRSLRVTSVSRRKAGTTEEPIEPVLAAFGDHF